RRVLFSLAAPGFAAPVVGREFVRCALDAAAAGAVAGLVRRLILLDRHIRIAEADQLGLVAGLGQHGKLLGAVRCALGFVVAGEGFSSVFDAHTFLSNFARACL
ncbi:MAG: hypothetical protein ACK55I_08830, partial [bacterium]